MADTHTADSASHGESPVLPGDVVPIIAMRNVALLPGTVVPITLGREESFLQDAWSDAPGTLAFGHLAGDGQSVMGESDAAGGRLVEDCAALRAE